MRLLLVTIATFLLCARVDAESPLQSPTLGLSVVPAGGWTASDDSEEMANDVVLTSEHLGSPARLEIWVEDEPRRTLRGIWTGYRYGVVVEKGGSIESDNSVVLGGAPGRKLVYRLPGMNGEPQLCIDTVCLYKKRFFIAHCTLDAKATGYTAELDAMLHSLKFAKG